MLKSPLISFIIVIFAGTQARAGSQKLGAAVGICTASLRLESGYEFSSRVHIGGGLRYTRVDKAGGLTLGRSREWSVEKVDLHAANIFAAAEYKISPKISLGLNLDVTGFSTGPAQKIRSPSGAVYEGRPVSFNAFLTTINDRGTLNSEFYGAYRLYERLALRAGLSHQVTEYKAELPGAPRLQRFYNVFFVGLDFSLR